MLTKEVKSMIELEDRVKGLHKRRKLNEKDMDIDDFVPMKYVRAANKSKDRTKGKIPAC